MAPLTLTVILEGSDRVLGSDCTVEKPIAQLVKRLVARLGVEVRPGPGEGTR
jgi:hypothetical protein